MPIAISWVAYSRIMAMAADAPIITGIFSFLTPMDLFPLLVPMCLAGGAILGMVGSIYSVRRHLNV
jgi:cell division protein FtsX